MLEKEKKDNFMVKTIYAKEMEIKKELEKILRQAIEDVREEINRKRNESQSIYKPQRKFNQLASALSEGAIQDQISQQERERIVDVLMS